MLNILLTNDDGYNATGILLLKKKLTKYGHVVVVAPKEAMSAKSVTITLGRPIEVKKYEDDLYVVDGTPADSVSFGLSSFKTKFDLVVSGCNNGFNISYDTIYSGTVGACLESLTYRVPAIAVSCDGNFNIIEDYFEMVMDFILKNKLLSKEYLLNINFPHGDIVKDIKITSLYYREENTYFVKQSEDNYLALRDINDEKCIDVDSDVYCVYHNIVSITKLNKTNYLKEEK